jgi:hypothetical protein
MAAGVGARGPSIERAQLLVSKVFLVRVVQQARPLEKLMLLQRGLSEAAIKALLWYTRVAAITLREKTNALATTKERGGQHALLSSIIQCVCVLARARDLDEHQRHAAPTRRTRAWQATASSSVAAADARGLERQTLVAARASARRVASRPAAAAATTPRSPPASP